MAKKAKDAKRAKAETTEANQKVHFIEENKIWPIVMYPYKHPADRKGLELIYKELLKKLESDDRYAYPLTVINRQTHHRSLAATDEVRESYEYMRDSVISPRSKILDVWGIDTCSMWLQGLGHAFSRASELGHVNDVFWLIPGDFRYHTPPGKKALKKMHKIPENVYDGNCQLCLGEIKVTLNSPKQLIDTYGTYGLLYNWFPAEAQGIRKITSKPRTEFFAISYEFLRTALIQERWYGYEQTIVILLQNMRGERTVRPVATVKLGKIEDDPSTRSSLSAAMQQIERTERVMKLFWRELNEARHPGKWQDMFRQLDMQSEQVRGSAMTIMQQILGRK